MTDFSNMRKAILIISNSKDNFFRYKLNIWDVGGQTSLRSYWRNYYECTDGLIWVVDSADVDRLEDCRLELRKLLEEEVSKQVTI